MKKFGLALALLVCFAATALSACSDTENNTIENTLNSASANAETSTVVNVEITLEEAMDIALTDAKTDRETAAFTQAKLDIDDAEKHYDIDFKVGGVEHEYEISLDGKILKHELDKEDADDKNPDVSRGELGKETKTEVVGYISVDDAKVAVLAYSSIDKAEVGFVEADFDDEDNGEAAHYDIELVIDGKEYEYKVDAKTGKVISVEADND